MTAVHATPTAPAGARVVPGSTPYVVDLADPRAADPDLAGAKAANLARCAAAGLPVMPGLVVTTAATGRWLPGEPVHPDVLAALGPALGALWARHPGPLVVRSSSTLEDAEHSSLAGQFRSVLGVSGWERAVEAVADVRSSAAHVPLPGAGAGPIAVLIQPQVAAVRGGVLFGVDPVGGERRRLAVEVAPGTPDDLVSGRTAAAHLILSRRGRRISATGGGATLSRREQRALARIATRVARLFGRAQDVEWAVDATGALWVLQSRPVTAVADAPAGPIFGPGPVAETFPEPLRRLEVELWLDPLGAGIARALLVTGAVPAHWVAASPVVRAVDGWAAVDLHLLAGERSRGRRWLPLPGLRRLAAAWRVGRLRAALPGLAADLADRVDVHLSDVPPLAQLGDADLVNVLANAADDLVAVHGYEVLAGMLLGDEPGTTPAEVVALAVLARARGDGRDDAAILATDPVTLALVPPRFGGTRSLPDPSPGPSPAAGTDAGLGARDALRLRARWLQELSARAMAELGERLVAAGRLTRRELVRDLGLAELRTAVVGGPLPADVERRAARPPGPPLPAAFRLTPTGRVIAAGRAGAPAGLGAGGGRAVGPARHIPPAGAVRSGDVLVVATLDPGLAAVLPDLAGLVAETGSALSHLAIVARELGVATVVAVPDARRRFPPGARLLVDGRTGEVRRLDGGEEAAVGEAFDGGDAFDGDEASDRDEEEVR
ncbi:MAG TPA: PEP/pyruvate-binding domain-containing protein [Acidimicrobiales bacterium]|nr:PEP/pyruvate-binding domain-containing protein [Acidimicrobiales bacterium]